MEFLSNRPAIPALLALACLAACGGSDDDTQGSLAGSSSSEGSETVGTEEENGSSGPMGAASPSTPSAANESSPSPPDDGDVPSFSADISPILQANCGSCHATGGLPRFAGSDRAASYTVAVSRSDAIIERLAQGTMPPSCGREPPGTSGCIGADDYELIQRWVDGGTPE